MKNNTSKLNSNSNLKFANDLKNNLRKKDSENIEATGNVYENKISTKDSPSNFHNILNKNNLNVQSKTKNNQKGKFVFFIKKY